MQTKLLKRLNVFLKGPWRVLEAGLKMLEVGLKGAWRALEEGLKGTSSVLEASLSRNQSVWLFTVPFASERLPFVNQKPSYFISSWYDSNWEFDSCRNIWSGPLCAIVRSAWKAPESAPRLKKQPGLNHSLIDLDWSELLLGDTFRHIVRCTHFTQSNCRETTSCLYDGLARVFSKFGHETVTAPSSDSQYLARIMAFVYNR